MTTFGRRAAGFLAALALAAPALAAPARRAAPSAGDDARIVHALSRLTFGPRPGDVDEVRRVGVSEWIERQLHPEADPGRRPRVAARGAAARCASPPPRS